MKKQHKSKSKLFLSTEVIRKIRAIPETELVHVAGRGSDHPGCSNGDNQCTSW
jgi:hypothetical protein